MRTVIVFSVLTAMILSSCSSKEKSEKTEKVATLLSQVKKTRDMLTSVNLKEIKAIDSVFSMDIQSIAKSNIDFSKPESKVVVDYMKIRRPFSNFIRDYSRTLTQLDSLQSRLYSLKSRVKKGNIQPEAFNMSYNQNKSILTELNFRTGKMVAAIKQNKKLRESLRADFLGLAGKK